jgi:TrmH family RNA methyltransferase
MLGKTQVKYIQSLYHKKFRDEYGLFVVEGPKIVGEIITQAPELLNAIYATNEWIELHKNLLRNEKEIAIIAVTDVELERISSLSTPNQVLAILYKKKDAEIPELKGKITLVLDGIQDPGNMGTIIRIADWFGIGHIVCSEDCADAYNSKVIQSSMGSIIRVNLKYRELNSFLENATNIPVFAAALGGENVYGLKAQPECLLIIGNESKGIRPELLNRVTKKITIPRIGAAESLNAAVATGINFSHITTAST